MTELTESKDSANPGLFGLRVNSALLGNGIDMGISVTWEKGAYGTRIRNYLVPLKLFPSTRRGCLGAKRQEKAMSEVSV